MDFDNLIFLDDFTKAETDEEYEWYKSQISQVPLPGTTPNTDDEPLPF